eukprot:5763874-Pyramimonas_sp.AAC.1
MHRWLKACEQNWSFLARAVQMTGGYSKAAERPEKMPPRPEKSDRLTLLSHETYYLPSRQDWICKLCNVAAKSELTLRSV